MLIIYLMHLILLNITSQRNKLMIIQHIYIQAIICAENISQLIDQHKLIFQQFL